MDANPNPRIADWVNRSELAIMTVTNTSPRLEGLEYRISMRMLRDGRPVVETRQNQVTTRRLEFGTEVFLADEIITYNALNFSGGFEQKIAQTGMLPAGFYSFCVSLLDLQGQPVSTPQEVCMPMKITGYQAPELIYPTSGMQLTPQALAGTQFSWTPLTPAPPAELGVKYFLTLVEVQIPQAASHAFFVNYPVIEEEVMGMTQMLWPVDLDPPVVTTNYVWSVKAVTLDDDPWIDTNSGYASLGTFTVVVPAATEDEDEEDGEEGEEEEEEELPPPGVIAASDTLYAGQNGEFVVLVTEATAKGQAFSGAGTVFVGWLNARVEVAFDSITVDVDKKLIDGKIIAKKYDTAPVYPVDWALEALAQASFTHQTVDIVVDWVENQSGLSIPYENPTAYTNPVKMPLGLNFPNGTEYAITEMVFRSDKSEFNAIAAQAVPPSWGTTRLGFRGKNFRFHPMTIELPPGRIELVEDITMGNVNNKIQFVFKKPDTNHLGCYIEWDEDGFKEYGLELEALFTRDWLIPSPDDDPNRKVAASLSVQGTSWTDLILGGTLERAEIVNGAGMTILADSIFYDFSDVLNPPGITFPENYEGETSELFRGFYMSALEVELPEAWQTHAGGQPKIAVYDMIIDNMGLTMLAKATNVLQFPNANVADLVASIDTVHVEMVAGSLTEAGIKGKVGLPVSKKDSLQNPLEYIALFNNPQTPGQPVSFQLTMTPTGPIPAHLLKGDITLAQTSSMVAYVDKNKKTFDMTLNGTFGWSNVKLGPINNVNLGLGFQGLGFSYDSEDDDENAFQFNIGSWSFASEQKFLANFPVSIDNIGYSMLSPQPGQLIRGRVNFDVIFNLSEDIGGMTRLGVEMAMQNNVNGQKFYPQYLSTGIDSINIHANLSAVSIQGAIGFRNEHPVYGNGFIGNIYADFKPVGIQATVLAEFGNTSYQNSNQLYRYWRVEGNVNIPAPGVVFLPGLAFRGFGGGAFFNMEAEANGTSYSFTPKKSTFGFRAQTTIATTPKEDGFNADVALMGQFASGGGLTYIAFTGDFWSGASLQASSRAKAMIKGDLSASYNFPDRHFNFTTNVNVNAPPITTPSPVNMVLDIRGKENKWYFKFGEPQNLNTVRVFGINLYEYLMFGNDIPIPSGFTSTFRNAYHGAVGHYPGGVSGGGVGSHTNTGSGFAMGIGFKFNHSDLKKLTGNYYLAYQLGAGAELHLAFLDYSGGCSAFNPVGINGWRANGGLGFYGYAGAQVRRIGGTLADKTWNIASLAAGAWVYGEFPNPWYVQGAVSGHATVLKVIDVSFNKSFQAGTRCYNSPAPGSPPLAQQDLAADQQNQLVQYVKPAATFNYPTEAPVTVKFGLEPGHVFDVSEQQANGTILNRTFRLDITRSLQVQHPDNNTWSGVMLNTARNNLGEFLYTTIPPVGSGPAGMAGPGIGPGTGTGSGSGTSPGGTAGKGSGTGSAPSTGIVPGFGLNASVMMQMGGSKGGTGSGTGTSTGTTGGTGQAPAGNMATGNGNGTGSGTGTGSGLPGLGGALIDPVGPGFNITYPVQPPEPSYGDLPPTSPPPVNHLVQDRNYRFTVTATLKEFKNGSWVNALKADGSPVTQTVTKNFRTGPVPLAPAANLPALTN